MSYKEGTYNVVVEGHNDKIEVSVEISSDKINAITVTNHKETPGISDSAIEKIPNDIIEHQSLAVNAVTGATVTSNALIKAVSIAVKDAGGDADALKNIAVDKVAGEDVDIDTDVVIVGAGGAGMSAAAQVLDLGKKVVVLEAAGAVGGNTILAGGMMNATDPEWQKKDPRFAGELETLQSMATMSDDEIDPEYLDDFHIFQEQLKSYEEDIENGEDYLFDSYEFFCIQTYLGGKREGLDGEVIYGDYDLVKTLTSKSIDSVHWLEDKGVEFNHDKVNTLVGAMWRRGHDSLGADYGIPFFNALTPYVEEHGGEILLETRAEHLITDDSGKIVGVEAKQSDGSTVTVNASMGVILTTGGFGANTEMVQKYDNYWGNIPNDIMTTNTSTIRGDGIEMAAEVDADTVHMGYAQLMPVASPHTGGIDKGFILAPPPDFVFVNKEGKRFVNESAERDVLAKAAIANGLDFYIISDDKIKESLLSTTDEKLEKEVADGELYKADTIEKLAEQLDINPDTLVETIKKYNSYVDAGHDPEFNKGSFDHKIEKAPYYATPCVPSIHHTMGGLKIDKEAHVYNKNNDVINGLYAAGEVAGGVHAGNRLGANALTDIFVFGPIAADTLVKEQS